MAGRTHHRRRTRLLLRAAVGDAVHSVVEIVGHVRRPLWLTPAADALSPPRQAMTINVGVRVNDERVPYDHACDHGWISW